MKTPPGVRPAAGGKTTFWWEETVKEKHITNVDYETGEVFDLTEEEMRKYIADHMARHKVPRYIEFVSAFPMNAAGKILKYKMREEAEIKLGLKK